LTIVSVKTGNEKPGAGKGFRQIEFSDGTFFTFNACYLSSVNESLYTPGAAEGLEISAADAEDIRFASACLRAETAALRLIARAEQNTFGLTRKLEKRGHDLVNIRAAISRLCDLNLLDDRRYARLWLESRLNCRATSPRRLLVSLCARGVDRDDAEFALAKVLDDEGELTLLGRFAQKIKRKQKNAGDGRRPLSYLLKSEGFSSRAVQRFFEDQPEGIG
jgi:regulatory protein